MLFLLQYVCVRVSSGQVHELTVMDKEKEHMSRLKDVVDMKVQQVTSTIQGTKEGGIINKKCLALLVL